MSLSFAGGVVAHPPQPKSGQFIICPGVISVAGSAPTGLATAFSWIDIGPMPLKVNGLAATVTTAASGGTGLALQLGLFADDGSSCYPGSLVQNAGSVVLSAIGQVVAAFTTITLQPGRYWAAGKYTYTTAPTTAPQLQQLTAVAPSLPGALIASNYRGYVATGQTAGAFSAAAPSGMSPATSGVILVGLRAA